jgi:PAS domain S-box-containing protein
MGGPLTWQLEDLGKHIKLLEETLTQLKSLDLTLHEMQFIVYSYVEKIREGVVLIQDEILVWANKAACDILGYQYDEVINKSVVDLVHPKHRDQLSARFAMVQAGDQIPTGVVWPFISKTREIKYVKPFSSHVIYNGKPAIMAFFSDVTEEKKVQDDLALRAEMLELVGDLVFMLDSKGDIKYANKAMCETLGYTRDEIIGRSILDFQTEEHRERVKIRLKLATPTSQGKYKTGYVKKDGTSILVSVKGKVINLGGTEYILGVGRMVLPYDGPI